MNKITLEMQKVQNVNKIIFFGLLFMQTSVFSQKNYIGIFSDTTIGDYEKQHIEFLDEKRFKYVCSGDVGVSEYGKGHYILTKDSLFLNYDLTDIRIVGYHIVKPYINKKDTIQINVKVLDYNKEALENVQVLISGIKIGNSFLAEGLTNKEGEISLFYKKPQDDVRFQFIDNDSVYALTLSGNFCYELEIYFSRIPDHLRGHPIKNTIQKYKIVKRKKDYIELQQPNGIVLPFKKVDKSFYDDAFFK